MDTPSNLAVDKTLIGLLLKRIGKKFRFNLAKEMHNSLHFAPFTWNLSPFAF